MNELDEKLERYSDVGYAFVILTPDDVGGAESRFATDVIRELFRNEDSLNAHNRPSFQRHIGYHIGKT